MVKCCRAGKNWVRAQVVDSILGVIVTGSGSIKTGHSGEVGSSVGLVRTGFAPWWWLLFRV